MKGWGWRRQTSCHNTKHKTRNDSDRIISRCFCPLRQYSVARRKKKENKMMIKNEQEHRKTTTSRKFWRACPRVSCWARRLCPGSRFIVTSLPATTAAASSSCLLVSRRHDHQHDDDRDDIHPLKLDSHTHTHAGAHKHTTNQLGSLWKWQLPARSHTV